VKANAGRAPLSVKRQQIEGPVAIQQQEPEVEYQVEAAVAEAITHDGATWHESEGVTVEPYIPTGTREHHEEPRLREAPVPTVHVPSHAERPDGRRLPRTEELPAVARRSLEATEKHEVEPRNARALFKRLASNVGFNLKPSAAPSHEEPHASSSDDAAARNAIEAGSARVSASSEGAQGNLDAHGRVKPKAAPKEHLEIPSFLRKHG
jgi:cell division protein FtsZ